MLKTIPHLKIEGIASAYPNQLLDLYTQTQFNPETIEKITKSVGTRFIRTTKPGQTASDLCFHAALHLIRKLEIDLKTIDGLIFVTSSPDYMNTATSAHLQHRLGLGSQILTADLNYGCSGYTYGLIHGASLIQSGLCSLILVLVGESPTKLIDPNDRTTRFLFSDGGSATLISKGHDILSFSFGVDGSKYRTILSSGMGFREPDSEKFLRMDGAEVLSFVTSQVAPSILQFLKNLNIPQDEIELWAIHQANKMVLDYFQKKFSIPKEKIPSNLINLGNMGGASIPQMLSSLKFAETDHLIKNCLFAGFGVGLSWSTACIHINFKTIFKPLEIHD